jgi:NACalpha-BTF3-like transcription factor
MWMEVIIIILILLLGVAAFIIKNQMDKVNTCENMLTKADETHTNTLNKIVSWMGISLDKLHNIDRLQIFEADDDVGWFFKTLKFQITELNNQIATIIGEESIDEENQEEEK